MKSRSCGKGSISTDLSSLQNARITDLCQEDREKIAELLRTLAKLTDEKDDVLKQLESERSTYAEKKSEMSAKYKQLLREKKVIKRSMDDCEKLIAELQMVLQVQQQQQRHQLPISSCQNSISVQTETDEIPTRGPPARSPKVIDRQQITNLVSNLRNGVECFEQRLTMESALRQQELALREKQALLDIKQKEFQKRFEYFARHGCFPDNDRKSPKRDVQIKSIVENSTQQSPRTPIGRRSFATSPCKFASREKETVTCNVVATPKVTKPPGEICDMDKELSTIEDISLLLATSNEATKLTSTAKRPPSEKVKVLNNSFLQTSRSSPEDFDDTEIIDDIFFLH